MFHRHGLLHSRRISLLPCRRSQSHSPRFLRRRQQQAHHHVLDRPIHLSAPIRKPHPAPSDAKDPGKTPLASRPRSLLINLQIASLAWLRPPGQDNDAKLSKSDFEKRKELFLEFVYWLFDSFLIPLIRSNFHVTESNVHRNKLFYFRHDVWRMLTEPSLTTLKANMFEHVPSDRMARLLSMRPLGFSKIRLLPKRNGFRTIMNLKRRQQVMRNGTMSLARSINTVMTPVFNVITYEKVSTQPYSTVHTQLTLARLYNPTYSDAPSSP
jgi:hypothetical protein